MERRQFLVQSLTVTAGIATVPSITAATEASTSIIDEGIKTEINDQFQKGDPEKAREILDEYGIWYRSNKSSYEYTDEDRHQEDDDNEATPEQSYANPNLGGGMFDLGAYQYNTPNQHLLNLNWDLEEDQTVSSSEPRDIVAISFSDVDYRPVSGTEYFNDHSNLLYDDNTNQYGYRAEIDWGITHPGEGDWGNMQIVVEERSSSSSTTTLFSDYIHTWASIFTGWSLSFDLVGPGSIQVSEDGSTEYWSAEDNIEYIP